MRQLATIRRISSLSPITNKDRIELARVDGWQVIVQKGEYAPGNKTIYVEIDSKLPERPEFEFLRARNFLVKTLKMGGVISQGICFPLSILPEGKYRVGADVTALLGIYQYNQDAEDDDNVINMHKYGPITRYLMRYYWIRNLVKHWEARNRLPVFISKTHETRIQNLPLLIQDKTLKYTATEKVDGKSATFSLLQVGTSLFGKPKYDFAVCSHRLRIHRKRNSEFWKIAKKYHIREVLEKCIGTERFVAIQGEIVGPGIRGNVYELTDYELYVFNLIYPNGRVVDSIGRETTLQYGIPWVPLVAEDYTLPDTIDEVVLFATDKSKLHHGLREGLVLRNYARNISVKVVSPEYLLARGE